MGQHRHLRRGTRWAAVVATAAVLGATLVAGVGGPAGAQKSGGDIRFGLEAETTGGFCIPTAQLVVSGIQVAAAVYDTLTMPNTKDEYVPNLAESVTPNATFDQWTIKLRPGITFHDGTPLNAAAVKQNMDAWKKGRLFQFVYSNMGDVTVVDDLTLNVTTKTPWPAFPGFLYLQGRAGIAAPAQLSNTETCPTNLIGTGPFKLKEWKVNEALTVTKNESYWEKDAKGKALPCANSITFVPIPDSPQRETQLQGGQLDMIHTSSAQSIDSIENSSGLDIVFDQKGNRETRYYQINASKPPFDNPTARQALAYALNTKEINTIRNKGLFTLATQTMDSNSPGYLKKSTYPKFNLKKAQELVSQVKAANGGSFDVTFLTTNDSENGAEGQLLVEQANKAGMNAKLTQVDQSSLVNELLGGNFSVSLVRNFHSDAAFGDVANYVWWSKGSPVNFSKFDDPNVQAALDAGRTSTDPAALAEAYTTFNEAMGKGVYVVPAWYSIWGLASKGITGQAGAPLPDKSKALVLNGRFPVETLCKK
ncbi:MAG: ABC transporter substrate-binding protein [Actinobacteria bacterium]|nr:ABC transporter substrate-binding protein [Actinomycetota bacterium]